MTWNAYQKAVLATFSDGDFRHLIDEPVPRAEWDDLGDTLLTFLLRELADDLVAPMNHETAVSRVRVGLEDMQLALNVIQTLTA